MSRIWVEQDCSKRKREIRTKLQELMNLKKKKKKADPEKGKKPAEPIAREAKRREHLKEKRVLNSQCGYWEKNKSRSRHRTNGGCW